jgi:anaerobic selenocysteine-containing dehydrogenase
MSKEKDGNTVPRRDFLRLAGLGGVAGAAAVAGASGAAEAASPEDGKSAGYRETAHVKTYYELAKF